MTFKRRITFQQWRAKLGPTMPLRMVPDVLGMTAEQVRRLVERRILEIHTFNALNGKVVRVVKTKDVDRIRQPKPKITIEGMRYAINRMVSASE